jgi:hypothetical protein
MSKNEKCTKKSNRNNCRDEPYLSTTVDSAYKVIDSDDSGKWRSNLPLPQPLEGTS